jgi:hypothetical protein
VGGEELLCVVQVAEPGELQQQQQQAVVVAVAWQRFPASTNPYRHLNRPSFFCVCEKYQCLQNQAESELLSWRVR